MFGWCFRISNEWISFPVNWIVSPVTPTVYVEPSLLKKARLAMTFFKLFINFRERKRPFSSSLLPLFQNESKCETFYMKMSFTCRFIFMLIKVIFYKNGFALRLALKQRHRGTRQWLILSVQHETIIENVNLASNRDYNHGAIIRIYGV